MRPIKKEKIGEIIHRLAADFVLRESTPASLLTITRVVMNDSAKVADIFFTTLPDSAQETALKFLDRKADEFKMFVRDHSRIHMLPFLRFKIDFGERNRQRLDEISTN